MSVTATVNFKVHPVTPESADDLEPKHNEKGDLF